MSMTQPSSGSTLSQELIRYIEVNRAEIDRFRYGAYSIRIVNRHLHSWTWEREERRGKEIDYL